MQVEVRGGMLPPVTKAGKSEGGAEEHASSDSSGNDAGGWAWLARAARDTQHQKLEGFNQH